MRPSPRELELAAEVDTLAERVLQLEALLGKSFQAPKVFGLSRSEEQILGMLMARPVANTEAMMTVIFHQDSDSEVNASGLVRAFIFRMRRKLKDHGVEIGTRKTAGYFLWDEGKARVRELGGVMA